MQPSSLIVLSGGQDSITTFYLAQKSTQVRGAVHFRYGQKHAVEFECAQWHTQRAGVPLYVLDVPAFEQIGDSALLPDAYGDDSGDVGAAHPRLKHLPASFVPGRNLVFLSLAAALAMKCGATEIWTGVCQSDDAGYPDCRQETLDQLEPALRAGMDFPALQIKAPLMNLSKARTFGLAEQLGVLHDVLEHTHTCYNGDHTTQNPWGYGCGKCPACGARAMGWEEFRAQYDS